MRRLAQNRDRRRRPGERRLVWRIGLVAALVAVAAAGCGGDEPARGVAMSTLEATLEDRDGDGFLERGPGEPLSDRGPAARPGRTLATFGQLTDTHVRDEESPARVPFLDRLGAPLNSTFRPHEAFSPQVLDAAVRALRREHPQALLVTGDIVDSAQQNELDQALAVLGGGEVDPDSGGGGYDGVQAASNPDPFLFRPDVDAPRHPGVLAAAQRPFRAAGARRRRGSRRSATTTSSSRARRRRASRSSGSRPATSWSPASTRTSSRPRTSTPPPRPWRRWSRSGTCSGAVSRCRPTRRGAT